MSIRQDVLRINGKAQEILTKRVTTHTVIRRGRHRMDHQKSFAITVMNQLLDEAQQVTLHQDEWSQKQSHRFLWTETILKVQCQRVRISISQMGPLRKDLLIWLLRTRKRALTNWISSHWSIFPRSEALWFSIVVAYQVAIARLGEVRLVIMHLLEVWIIPIWLALTVYKSLIKPNEKASHSTTATC